MRALAIALLAASLFRLTARLATLLTQNTFWQEASFAAVFGTLFAVGGLLAWRTHRYSARAFFIAATASTLTVPLIWLGLGWTLPRLARFLPALDSWPRVFVWLCLVHLLLLLPAAPLLGASLVRASREGRHGWMVPAGLVLGILLAGPWLQVALSGPLGTLELFPATAALVLLLGASRSPRRNVLIFFFLCLGFTFWQPGALLAGSLQSRFGNLLALADEPAGISMVTDDVNRGRLLRGPDGRATYAQAMLRDDRFLAHLPVILHGDAKKMLFLGRGSGHAVAAAREHRGLNIEVRDRSGEPPGLSAWLSESTDDPAPSTISAPACGRITGGSFDVILLQPPPVTSEAFVACLSPKFLESIAAALGPGGIYAMKIDPGTLPVAELALIVSQLNATFPDVTIWAGQPATRWTAIASNEKLTLNLAQLRQFWREPQVAASLQSTGRSTPFHLLAEFLMGRTTAVTFTETFIEPAAAIEGIAARTAQHPNSNFGFAAATSDDWTVALLGGDSILPGAFRVIFAQIARSEAWRQDARSVLRSQPGEALSLEEIVQIIESLRASMAADGEK